MSGSRQAKNRVHYLSFYLSEGQESLREPVPAGFAKVEYIATTLLDAGLQVDLVSTAFARVGVGYQPCQVSQLGDRERLVYLASIRPKGRIGYAVSLAFMWLQLLRYLLFEVDRHETVLVYHSLLYIWPIGIARRLKSFRVVLELNDLYHAVSKKHRIWRRIEQRYIDRADAYLFMNNITGRRFGLGAPFIISYGSYSIPVRHRWRADDDKIHVVYAGIIEDERRAAQLAVEAALHLNDRYTLHVLGFGAARQIESLIKRIDQVNDEMSRQAVIFHGQLRGREFADFLHGCHLGISSHSYRPDEVDSADFTFPSKITVYMAHDLPVVSPSIPCVVDSPFAEFTTFYNEHSPASIAAAIEASTALEVGRSSRSPVALMRELDHRFRLDIEQVISTRASGG